MSGIFPTEDELMRQLFRVHCMLCFFSIATGYFVDGKKYDAISPIKGLDKSIPIVCKPGILMGLEYEPNLVMA